MAGMARAGDVAAMLGLDELRRLVTTVCETALAPQVGPDGGLIRRWVARFAALDEESRAGISEACVGLEPIVRGLLVSAATERPLAASELRDVVTVSRRLATVMAHVGPRAGAGRLDASALHVAYARTDLVGVLGYACGCFEELAAERGITFEVSLPSELVADVDRAKIELAVGNALFNAFKHAPEGGLVCCTAAVDEALQDVVISIEDDGPGVDLAQLDAIFDRGRVAERNVATCLDVGELSLASSRDAIALHGGILDTVPTSTGRALFEIRLPRWAPGGVDVAAQAPPAALWLADVAARAGADLRAEAELGTTTSIGDGRPTVLVIEGSRALNRAIASGLEPYYSATSVFDAGAGVERARDVRPDLVIIDVDLPDASGEQAVQSLRQHDTGGAAILAIVGGRDESRISRLLEAGVDDVVFKPVLLTELFVRVRRMLAAKKARDVLSATLGQRDTELVALARQLAETRPELERVDAELAAARERIERMHRDKYAFLRIMSHELKTPVTAMKLQLTVLESDPDVRHTKALDVGLERIDRSGRRLLDILDTMLEWARVEGGRHRPEVEAFDLADLTEEVVARLENHARVRQTLVSIEDTRPRPRSIVNDRRLVRLVVINLLERAISVSNAARVEIRVVESAQGDRVHIRDAADPMNADQRAEVFDPIGITRTIHRSRGAGSGLGVYASRDIARAVGGEIRWEDYSGPGNELSFDVPSRRPEKFDGGVRRDQH